MARLFPACGEVRGDACEPMDANPLQTPFVVFRGWARRRDMRPGADISGQIRTNLDNCGQIRTWIGWDTERPLDGAGGVE
jgi:hypothetical protein